MTHELYPQGLSDASVVPRRKALLAGQASKIIAVSENTRQDVIRILGVSPEKVVTIPHGNSLTGSRVVPVRPDWPGSYWLYVGARGDYKNWRLLVEALAIRHDPEDRLVMVGGGPLTAEENRLLSASGLGGRYRQTGASEAELAGWYAGARALVYPSLYEGFGMPLVEAMAWGCPVAAARSSCLPEVGGEAAVYFDPLSAEDLNRALNSVGDPAVSTRLATLGREREKQFTWGKTAEATWAVYKDCL